MGFLYCHDNDGWVRVIIIWLHTQTGGSGMSFMGGVGKAFAFLVFFSSISVGFL